MSLGRILSYSKYELKVTLASEVTGSWPDDAFATGSVMSQWVVDPTTGIVEMGFRVLVSAVEGDGDSRWQWTCPALGIDVTSTASEHLSTMTASAVLHGVDLYIEHGEYIQWKLNIDSVELLKEGAVHQVVSGPFEVEGPWITPAGIPLFGIPPMLSGGAGISPVPSDVSFDDGTDGTSTTTYHPLTARFLDAVDGEPSDLEDVFAATTYSPCGLTGTHIVHTSPSETEVGVNVPWTASGGWRFEAGGQWHTPPVTLPEIEFGGAECSVSHATEPDLEAETTWDGVVGGHYAYSQSSTVRTWNEAAAWLCLLPDLPKSVNRVEPDTYKALVVRYGLPQAISRLNWSCTSLGGTIAKGAFTAFSFPQLTVAEDNIPYFQMADQPLPTYINTWASPHWHCYLWFPDDDATGELTDYDWPVDGERATCHDYWGRIGQQWIHHPPLPSPKETETRVDVLTEPVRWGPLTALIKEAILGHAATSWWGISFFRTETPAWAGSSTTTGSGWTIEGASADHDDGEVVLTPSAEEVVVEYDLTAEHWHRLAAAKILTTWSGSGIESGRAYLVAADGRELLLSAEPMESAALRPRGKNRKFAGTWAQDYGSGFAEVEGEDTHKRGDSAAVAADPDRLFQLQLAHAYGAAKMRWRFQVSGTSPITLSYPVFYAPEEGGLVLTETSRFGPILYAESPGFRWGNVKWWSDSGHHHPPLVRELGSPPTALDWMSWKRVLYEARDYNDGFQDEINTVWGPEGITTKSVLAAQTSWFMAPIGTHGTAVLQNLYSCVPPQPCLPWFAKDAALIDTDDLEQNAWSHCVEPRYYVEPEGFDLVSPTAGTPWTGESAKEMTGWTIREHRNRTTGYEMADFLVRQRSRDWAKASPWHGAFASLRLHAQARCALDTLRSDLQLKMWIDEDREVRFGMRAAKEGDSFSNVATGLTGNCLAARWSRTDAAPFVWLLLADDTTVKLYRSEDFGETWIMAEELATGNALGAVALATAPDGSIYAYWIDDGEVNGTIRDGTLKERSAADPARAEVEDEGLALTWFTRHAGQPQLGMLTVEDDTVVLTESVDGKVFE